MLRLRPNRAFSSARPLTDLEHAMVHSEHMVVQITRALDEQKQCNMQIRQLQHMYKPQNRRFSHVDMAHLERALEAQRQLLSDTNEAVSMCLDIADLSNEERQVRFVEAKAKRLHTVLGNFGAEIQEFDRLLSEARK